MTGMPPRPFVIALDGPAASGKSTVGLGAGQRLGFFYFDTGVLYRALTWLALQQGVPVGDGAALAALARAFAVTVGPATVQDGRQVDVVADGQDLSLQVRAPAVDRNVSPVSAHAAVRGALVTAQRAAIRPPGTILAGRDIGTVIVPDAPLKIWLEASLAERARRRASQTGADARAVLAQMQERDHIDGTRAVAPMVAAEDAIVVQTDSLAVEEVIERIVQLAEARMATTATWSTYGADRRS